MMIDRDFSASPVQDLADFYISWPQLRCHCASILERPDLSKDERDVLTWLQALADRIGPEDLS